jgi:hypothetical protein
MGTSKFFEKSSLPDSEFVLFIDHDKLQILKIYILLQDGMRTDQDMDLALFQVRFYFVFFSFG